ncbi:imidazole glycerol phosphate synthase subunit HisH [Shimazuella kribbensis]|uniref:imidazole glycerol phosphate synthase subunit HisH n=1 Tax=Shimazuella kribbensis TaxID=139808 RepID=UPI0003FAF3B1|nr:imidazole glycerol phosphate synthase subunit HisH [Shimazuella kribbensis]
MIAIIDYGMGNLYSLSQALQRLDHEYVITDDVETIQKADKMILPGVGAFGDAMRELNQRGLTKIIFEEAIAGKPLLGICLGMQLLFTGSDEHGYYSGLNLLAGHVKEIKVDLPVPHMGWNWLSFRHPHPLFRSLEEGHVYFVHSYHVQASNTEDVIATTDYSQDFTAIVARKNIIGMQFHPEKSGPLGMQLLHQFAEGRI